MNRLVLIVEDDDDIRVTLCEVLEDAGFRTVGAREGREALTWIRGAEQLPDLVLLDMMMPILDGNGFLSAVRADPQLARLRVVLLSAQRGLERYARADVVGWIEKPVRLEKLLDTVEASLHAV